MELKMNQSLANYTIGFPLYDKFDSLDVLGPFQVFTFLGANPVLLAAKDTVTSFEGVTVKPNNTFDDIYHGKVKLDAFFVPGASSQGLQGVLDLGPLGKNVYLDFLVSQAQLPTVKLHLSVCTGALLLGAAGLLKGYTATTHWAFLSILESFEGVTVASGYPRYVIDRNLVTGGGISSGIDEALAIAAILSDDATAQRIQLSMQYAPNPPYQSGDPSQAGPTVMYAASNYMDITNVAKSFAKFTHQSERVAPAR
jgi:cyclohexyl-isocyanide hydratase